MKLPSNLSFLTVPGLVLLLAVAGRAQGSDLKDAVTKTRDPACTGKCKPVTWTKDPVPGQPSRPPAQPRPECTPSSGKKQWHDPDDPLKPGDVNCRMWTNWYDDDIVEGEHTCEKLAGIYDCSLEKFYMLNPVLDAKCDLKPFTQYCVTGFIEPHRAWDGRCGPNHKNASCLGMEMGQCCSAITWTCGKTNKHCAAGNCYEGACWNFVGGHKFYTTDGTCGQQNEGRRCAGRWGECCSNEGRCGDGEEFCGWGKCQSGQCLAKPKESADVSTQEKTKGKDEL